MNTIGVSCPEFGTVPFDIRLNEIANDFSHWEIFSEVFHYAPLVASQYGELVKRSSLTFTLHTGIADINVASTNRLVREASVSNLIEEMKAANSLGIDTVTIHPGVINMAVKGIRDMSIGFANESMRKLEKAASEFGVFACIENMPNIPVMLGTSADELARIVDGTDLSICFDIGHANTCSQIDQMVKEFGDRIRNVHIHDNLGQRDDHMTIGDGQIDFKHVLALLSWYRHRFIIEARSMESARISQVRLRSLLNAQRC